ncbi:SAM-dependent methyltransferase [Sinorhizobium meliloti]|uniref:SAM-dependent methyltransferase n=1 Tax=Rhizobium meliloti TaxID=382 RepID=UPI0002A572A3|nr:SAM-dependent methyltransferase [Sinorhizobium meliloti]AGA07310.1 hypothetical protein C770_GR4Chr2388 [Sinorhizobium meliloti GR4]RVK98687.1 SAM-dependent methyltransferase [Sinorhizobium meliloti]RVM89538.1 SAM-dependent methyltransferase [Sinorhizobium meliloti]RVN01050.1 SAM-dependent methyltransferase [Sinorhizobium meliloti]
MRIIAGLGVELYDLFTGGGLLTGDVEFYLDSARRFGGPILELWTGTGRVLIRLADAGHEVVGMDFPVPCWIEPLQSSATGMS